MKLFYLSKGHFTHEYFLDSGAFGSRREVLGRDEDYLLCYLKDKIDKKRNTLLYIVNDEMPDEEIKKISKFFSNTKVQVKLESLLKLENPNFK